MVTMAQDFNIRYPMIHGMGNFGSLDGDPAAASRYTEAKFTKYGYQMLKDIEKGVCDMGRNYDDTEDEPIYLGSMLPNTLANGTEGIAVGMASKMLPHNLTEIFDAVLYIIDSVINEEEPDEEKIFDIIKGPDFPMGAEIIGRSGILQYFKTGKGQVKVRSVYDVVDKKNGTTDIIITELPYKVNKAGVIEKIDDLIKTEVFTEIKEVNDESDRKNPIRIVINLKKGANVQLAINKLFKYTELQTSYGVNNTVLVNGVPKVVTLMELLEVYFDQILDIIKRRSQYDYNKILQRYHIVEGMVYAVENKERTDDLIAIIRSSKGKEAINKLIEYSSTYQTDDEDSFVLDEEQAKAIVDMKLSSLTIDRVESLLEEQNKIAEEVNRLYDIINDDSCLLQQAKIEVLELKENFGDERRTKFTTDASSINEIDCIKEETLVVTLTSNGIIKSVEEKEYTSTRRGSKGTKAAPMKEDDAINTMLTVNSKSDLLFFTNLGRCHVLKAYKVDKCARTAKGKSVNNYLSLDQDETIVKLISTDLRNKDNSFALVTKNGIGKRLSFDDLSTCRSITKVITFKEDDMLIAVDVVNDNDDLIITTRKGMSIRFNCSDIRPMGRTAAGVRAINLSEDDYVVDAVKIEENSTILTVTEKGLAKRSEVSLYNTQSRGGKGTRTHKLTDKTGNLVCATCVNEDEELFICTAQGKIGRINVDTIRSAGKTTSGVRIMNLTEDDFIVSVSRNIKEETEEEVQE